jgi:hypothetical protein
MSTLVVSIPTGINLRNALDIARNLGCSVECVRRTGEIRVSHPRMLKSYKAKHPTRRKDCPMKLVVWLRSAAEQSCS